MFDVMVDLETTGLRPDRTAILQIAAVKFDYERETIDHGFFVRSLRVPPHRHWDESTRDWWGKRSTTYREIVARAENPSEVMQDFADWAGYNHPQTLRFWAKPISFDHAFVESYFNDYGIHSPFDYRHTVDMKSWMSGMLHGWTRNQINDELKKLPFEGVEHNALYDVLHQIKEVFHVKALKNA
jgi:DNA polymerase III epsilon subunit-like protein